MIVKDNQREILERDTKRNYIGINNHCELYLKDFLNNSTEIIDELLEFARENGITIKEEINIVLADFNKIYRKNINLLKIENEVFKNNRSFRRIDEELGWIKELNNKNNDNKNYEEFTESEKEIFSIETEEPTVKEMFSTAIIENISDLIFKCLRKAKYNENALNVFSKEGMIKYTEFIKNNGTNGENIIWVNWDKLVKDYALKAGDNINNTKFMVDVSICIEKGWKEEIREEIKMENMVAGKGMKYKARWGNIEIKIK